MRGGFLFWWVCRGEVLAFFGLRCAVWAMLVVESVRSELNPAVLAICPISQEEVPPRPGRGDLFHHFLLNIFIHLSQFSVLDQQHIFRRHDQGFMLVGLRLTCNNYISV